MSSCTTAKISENASTARTSPSVCRTMPHIAASASPAASNAIKNTRLLVQKQATANRAAAPSFATGFMRCSGLSPGTYSKNALMRAPFRNRRHRFHHVLERVRPPHRAFRKLGTRRASSKDTSTTCGGMSEARASVSRLRSTSNTGPSSTTRPSFITMQRFA